MSDTSTSIEFLFPHMAFMVQRKRRVYVRELLQRVLQLEPSGGVREVRLKTLGWPQTHGLYLTALRGFKNDTEYFRCLHACEADDERLIARHCRNDDRKRAFPTMLAILYDGVERIHLKPDGHLGIIMMADPLRNPADLDNRHDWPWEPGLSGAYE